MNTQVKRGCFLSGILWLQLIFSSLWLILTIIARIAGNDSTDISKEFALTTGEFIYIVVALTLSIISIVLILLWKKYGVYLFLALSAFGFIYSFIVSPFDVENVIKFVITFVIQLLIGYFSFKVINKRELSSYEE